MADKDASGLCSPSNEDLRIAAGHFEYAHRAITAGNHDIAIGMLRTCCRLVPGNLTYRQALRKTEKTKYNGNLRGSFFAPLTSWRSKLRMWRARRRGNHLKVLDQGEAVLMRNPWDRDTQLCMAEAAMALRQPVLAVWFLQEAREKNPNDVQVNRALARLLEKEGRFTLAIQLWELVRKARPTDHEATEKTRQLAVSDTLVRGNYEEAIVAEVAGVASGKTATARATPLPGTDASPVKSRSVQEIEVLRTRIAADPAVPDAYLQLAALHRRKGQLDEARAALEEGLAATRGDSSLALVLSEMEIDALRRARDQAEEELRAKPQDDKLHKAHKKVLHKLTSLELAMARQKVQREPGDQGLRFELGMRLFQAGQVEEAIAELQVARAEQRLYWKAVLYLGHCFASLEKWPLAQRNFEEALRSLPDGEKEHRKEVLFLLARGYAEASELPRAIELGLDLADLDYSYRNIGQLLEEWQRRMQEPRRPTRSR